MTTPTTNPKIDAYLSEGCMRNVLIMAAFKDYCAINFFKGSLLKDTNGILIEHTQAGRQIRFTNGRDIVEMEPILKAYVYEAQILDGKPFYK